MQKWFVCHKDMLHIVAVMPTRQAADTRRGFQKGLLEPAGVLNLRQTAGQTTTPGVYVSNTMHISSRPARLFGTHGLTCQHSHRDAGALARCHCRWDLAADGIRDAHDRQQREVPLELLGHGGIAAGGCR